MVQVKFRNLEKSELAVSAVTERMEAIRHKFPALEPSRMRVTVEMESSLDQPGPDLFRVKLHVVRGRFDGITAEKSNSNLFAALADLSDHLLEVFNRSGNKARVREQDNARRLVRDSMRGRRL